MRISHLEELALIESVLAACGVPDEVAGLQAEWLAEADLRGHPSHGVQRLPTIVGRLDRGLARPEARPGATWRAPALASVDADRALGPVAGTFTVELVATRARATGVALAAVRGSGHLGLLAPYVERLAAQGLIGLVLTSTEALVHPWNGGAPMVGTNPIAIGIPTPTDPFVLDMATSAISMGRVISHRQRGEPLAPGWAVDADGAPATDPHTARAISPAGGAKGYGLGLAFGLLVAALTGTALGEDVRGTLDIESEANKGDLFVAIDPASVGWDDGAALGAYLEWLRAAAPAPGAAAVSVPGDGSRERRRRALAEGVEVPATVVEELRRLEGATGVLR